MKYVDGRDDEWGRYLSYYNEERPLNRHLTDSEWLSKYQGVPWESEEFLHSDVFIGDSALSWLNRYDSSKPVFLQVGFTGPHEVYDPLPRHYEYYKDKTMPSAYTEENELTNKPPQHSAHQEYFRRADGDAQIDMKQASDKDIEHLRRHYYAKVSTIDEKIGEIMHSLDQKGYLDNAIVVFTSDHGDMLGDHKLPYKWLMYDSVVHVPLIFWDTRYESFEQNNDLVSLIDIGPSILEAAGINVPSYLDGSSFYKKIYENYDQPHRQYVICEDNYLTMIRSQRYKLIMYTDQEDDGEFYDLKNDPHELHNLYSDTTYSEVKNKLQLSLLQCMLKSTYHNAIYKMVTLKRICFLQKIIIFLHPITKKKPDEWYVK